MPRKCLYLAAASRRTAQVKKDALLLIKKVSKVARYYHSRNQKLRSRLS